VVDEGTDLSREANDDVIVTDVRTRDEKIPRIVNVYDQRDMQLGERTAQTVNWQRVSRQGGTHLAGDCNADSSRWDPRCRAQRDAASWEVVIDGNGFGNWE